MPLSSQPPQPTQYQLRCRRPLILTGACLALMIAGTSVAGAHVSVTPESAPSGESAVLTFTAVNENPDASILKVEIQLPEETPFPVVRAKSQPGWTVEVKTSKLPAAVTIDKVTIDEAVTSVIFTADPASPGIGKNEFGEFGVSVGPLPDVERVLFTAIETYSDGSVSTWDEPPVDGGEPEFPAPALVISHGSSGLAERAESAPAPSAEGGYDPAARYLAIGGLTLAVLGVGLALLGWRKRRNSSPAS